MKTELSIRETGLAVRFLLTMLAVTTLMTTTSAVADRQGTDDEQMVEDPRVQHRTYVFPETGETIPYALFVPSSYRDGVAAPLIIALHGLGRSYDWLMGYNGFLDYAEEGGYIVATPLGYIRRGWYGAREISEDPMDGVYSEQDVMNVMALLRTEFSVDEDRLYLWGHSMGGAGTYHIAVKNPDLFAGIAVAAPAPRRDLDPQVLEAIVDVPVLVIHGDDDQTVPVELSRQWVAKMRELGMQHLYVEVPGGDHSLIVSRDRENMKKIVDFFNIVRRRY